jgi:hypothetical protein
VYAGVHIFSYVHECYTRIVLLGGGGKSGVLYPAETQVITRQSLLSSDDHFEQYRYGEFVKTMTSFPFKLFLIFLHFFTFLPKCFPLLSCFSIYTFFAFPSCFVHTVLLIFINPLLVCFLHFTFHFLPFPPSLPLLILLPPLLYLALQSPLIPSGCFLPLLQQLNSASTLPTQCPDQQSNQGSMPARAKKFFLSATGADSLCGSPNLLPNGCFPDCKVAKM